MKDEKSLEAQIGNLGGEPQEESLVGKKLKHIPGQREELNSEEDAEMNAFLSRSRSHENFNDRSSGTQQITSIAQGWIPINRSEMGVRSQFYPDDWEFYVRPATVEAIKNWSSIDEERIDIVNTVFNDIIRTCVSIHAASGNIPWNRINSWDRFWFIMKVRQFTFPNGESKVEFTDTCTECDQEITFTLTPEALFYEFPDDDIVEKYWNSVERAWYINPKDYDLDRPIVKLYVPTLEKDQAILDWAIAKTRDNKNKKPDSVFLRFAPWLLSKAPKDEQVFEKFMADCNATYKSWDVPMFEFMDDVVRNITINPSEKLRQVCPHCGEEVVSTVNFPNGIKSLFKTEARHKRFGSR